MLLLSDLMQQAWLKIDGVGDLIYSQWEKIFTFPNGFFFFMPHKTPLKESWDKNTEIMKYVLFCHSST